ncbi:MAG: hypothetical protein WBJ10_11380 [Daejeonella sp.]|uniref:hypothetical protein n=1 Tax=Daejeonella sp. TaxID=2805397 RepID=UPI003C730D97
MKTLLNIMISATLITLSGVGGCNKDSGTIAANEISAITEIEGPTTARVGEEQLFKVTLQGNNGCAVSGELKEIADGNLRTVAGKVHYKGEMCTQAIVYLVVDYRFKTSRPGTYELKFLKADKTFLTHTIKVN